MAESICHTQPICNDVEWMEGQWRNTAEQKHTNYIDDSKDFCTSNFSSYNFQCLSIFN